MTARRTPMILLGVLLLAGLPATAQQYTLDQTLSDQAQGTTIAFDGLAFLTGSLGADSFFPPGKVADFWGFQSLRDNDPTGMGHNTDFLTRAANSMLSVLGDDQVAQLVALAEGQIDEINRYALDRFVLMKAFRRVLEGDLPAGSAGLDTDAVVAWSAELYRLDGEISLERAAVMGGLLASLDAGQRATLDALAGEGMADWPDPGDQLDPRQYSHDVHVAVMTYAGDMLSWYLGSLEADVYFCPERQGTYFGSFYLKDAPAMGNPDYSIPTNLTGDYGRAFLEALTPAQAAAVEGLVDAQRAWLLEIVDVRRQVASELRRFLVGDAADGDAVLALMGRYGELDGFIVAAYATAFADVAGLLDAAQRVELAGLRSDLGVTVPDGAYLYSEPIAMPEVPDTDFLFLGTAAAEPPSYPVVDTGQSSCYDDLREIPCPASGEPFAGQDAQHAGNTPRYLDNGDGTVTDQVTGLMWSASPDLDGDGDIDAADKLGFDQALAGASGVTLAGHHDWRLPTITELYSLIDFSGVDPSGFDAVGGARPFIDTEVFEFGYGDVAAGERVIDAQFASSTLYGSTTMGGNRTMFGVNFADGRIKGYPADGKGFYVLWVRGNPEYGVNSFVDNGDGTVTDLATGLMWARGDSGEGLDWQQALAWVEQRNAEGFLGHDDWRLPDAKELQSLVDYGRSPDVTGSAALDPVFDATPITNEAGQPDFGCYWSSTTHLRDMDPGAEAAVYVAFGRAMGYMQGRWMDVHGAGAQRSDPKAGDPADYPYGRGPQGDAIRISNLVRPVRTAFSGGTPPALTAAFTFTPAAPAVGEVVRFTDASTGDPGSWQWDFGDGATSAERNPGHAFQAVGSFTVTLTVSDGEDASSTSRTVTVVDGSAPEAPPALVIPAAARLRGAGAFFSSRVELLDRSDSPITVEVVYTPRQDLGGGPRTATVGLAAGQMLSVDDALGAWFGVTDGEDAAGSLVLTVGEGDPDALLATSVVTATLDDGREYGQVIPALPAHAALAVGDVAHLGTTVDGARTRVNLGAAALADGTVVEIRPVDPVDTPLAEPVVLELDAGASRQLNDLARLFELGGRSDWLLEVTVAAGRAVVYGSVLDGRGDLPGTSDPTTLRPVVQGAPRVTLLELGTVEGYDDFSGSASISNLGGEAAEVEASLHLRGVPGVAATASLTLAAGETLGFDDVVGELFGVTGVGAVVLEGGDGAQLMATGREYSVLRDDSGGIVGTAGQLIPGLVERDLLRPGATGHLLGLRQRRTARGLERSHVAAFNPGDGDVELVLRLFDGASGAFEGELTMTVRGGELVQTNNVVEAVDPDQDGAPKRLEATADGPLWLAAFRVNPDGDPITLDPLVAGPPPPAP